MRTGRVKWFNVHESHGYIILIDGTEVYFHSSGLSSPHLSSLLGPGMDVAFDILQTRAGMEAHNIEAIG